MKLPVIAVGLFLAVGLSVTAFAREARAPSAAGTPSAFHCPVHGDDPTHPLPVDVRDALPLPGDGLAAAARAAFLQMTHPGAPKDRSRRGSWIVSATRANLADGELKLRARACGHHLGQRTVDVTLHYASSTPSASLSYGRVFVARYRLPGGQTRYLVWQVMH
jgi:hypothetical protein